MGFDFRESRLFIQSSVMLWDVFLVLLIRGHVIKVPVIFCVCLKVPEQVTLCSLELC